MIPAWANTYLRAFEELTPDTVNNLAVLFAENVRFHDPFNVAIGRSAVCKIFEHMFEILSNPRFSVVKASGEGVMCFARWNMSAYTKSGRAVHVAGVSEIMADESRLVIEHIDYWDPTVLADHSTILRPIVRFLRRRAAAN